MSFPLAFSPANGATAGKAVKVTANNTPSSVASTIAAASSVGANIRVTNTGTVLVFVRISGEAAPTATAADIAMLAGSTEVFMNPNPGGIVGIAALSSTTTACDVYFLCGEGS